ncbi:hypothetical protein NBRC111894_2366 [Sporolactobacillus inulinus]|uniref:Uncharacterized protein n=1 Tax=Sporolactobacillus inulinus TaxID=2078 RepID=A0A4Y1ZCI8_9BACL|nr:hypothetical protein NBRC111894_2366 [Sporolactobacillus inulinus]
MTKIYLHFLVVQDNNVNNKENKLKPISHFSLKMGNRLFLII